MVYSDDFFKTKKMLVSKGNKYLLSKGHLFVAQVVDQQTQEVMLLEANSTEKNYDVQPIDTNLKHFREHSYTFLDTKGYSVFLHVNHFGEVSKYGHIYTSDIHGRQFSLSLRYNLRTEDNQCDFEKVNTIY
jgi:hypothetical protein